MHLILPRRACIKVGGKLLLTAWSKQRTYRNSAVESSGNTRGQDSRVRPFSTVHATASCNPCMHCSCSRLDVCGIVSTCRHRYVYTQRVNVARKIRERLSHTDVARFGRSKLEKANVVKAVLCRGTAALWMLTKSGCREAAFPSHPAVKCVSWT